MLIRNAKDSAGKAIEVWLRDGKIAAVGLGLLVPEGEEVLDAKGRTVLPAFIDTHCHWRTPGFEYKEDISTGSAAAAAGGYTFVNLMPNTKPVCSSAEIVHAVELHSKSKNCPYDGALLYGKVVTTIKGGKVTFQIEE